MKALSLSLLVFCLSLPALGGKNNVSNEELVNLLRETFSPCQSGESLAFLGVEDGKGKYPGRVNIRFADDYRVADIRVFNITNDLDEFRSQQFYVPAKAPKGRPSRLKKYDNKYVLVAYRPSDPRADFTYGKHVEQKLVIYFGKNFEASSVKASTDSGKVRVDLQESPGCF